MPAKILLIEDDREIQSTLSGVLQAAGYDVRIAPNGIEGQKRIEEDRPDLIITDMMMPRMGGFPVLEYLKSLSDAPPVIMITANEGGRHKAYAEMLGVSDYLRKPFAMDVMLEAVAKALKAAEAKGGSSEAATGGDRLRRAVRKKALKKDEEE
ncbi:MAG: response regulator [Planctomycetota bacterium]|nr:response regulator [Planctomycetaceae bacterium]MDQ3330459.1 response regulator [Planctomycetota bacterium]